MLELVTLRVSLMEITAGALITSRVPDAQSNSVSFQRLAPRERSIRSIS